MLTLETERGVEYMKFKVTGDFAGQPVEVKAGHPVLACAEETASSARTVAAQLYASWSHIMRRTFIHTLEAALNEAMPRAVGQRPMQTVAIEMEERDGKLHLTICQGAMDTTANEKP